MPNHKEQLQAIIIIIINSIIHNNIHTHIHEPEEYGTRASLHEINALYTLHTHESHTLFLPTSNFGILPQRNSGRFE